MIRRRYRTSILTAALLSLLAMAFVAIGSTAGHVAGGQPPNAPLASIIPREPPRADKISFGPLNGLGEATVTGAPGAVLPSAHVLLINLDSSHQDYVLANPDGSFQAQIFAPPGSSIMIKHGPDHRFWQHTDQGATEPGYPVFPSTTIYRPLLNDAGVNSLPFAAAGGIGVDVDSMPSSIDAAWTLEGTVTPVTNLQPGDTINVTGTVRLYSQAISSTVDVSGIDLQLADSASWLMLYDNTGLPIPYNDFASSVRLTPSGFPILDGRRPEVLSAIDWDPVTWQYAGGNSLEGQLTFTMTLETDMPPGIYRPILGLQFTGVPKGSGWLAAILSSQAGVPSYNFGPSGAGLPPLQVNPAPTAIPAPAARSTSRRVIWQLLMDHASLGIRGTGAREDADSYQPSSFVVTQGAPYVLSPTDPYTGAPATYRIEPYLPMISYGRGAAPGPPLLPFALPGGQLCVTIEDPDGQLQDLGCDAFAQSVSGDESTVLGEPLNFGSEEVDEYYGLTTNNETFAVTFTKPGHHIIHMDGWTEDVWGNRYEGGGTYDVWVAQPLDIDPGLLPGTPLAVGNPINANVQLHPRQPAYVNLTVRHFPDSDPNQMEVHTIEGWANRFGHFAPSDPPITLNAPGEYRLDLVSDFFDPATGDYYMGAASWGGIVMTPPQQAQLVAHGRRGSDNVLQIPNQWFVFCDLTLLSGSTPHLLNPYLNGDILWTYPQAMEPECLGDALTLSASIQDTVGTVENAITDRYNNSFFPLHAPGTFAERVSKDALPLFSSTTSGLPVSMDPAATDQLAYAYLSSQRPGLRVREAVAEDGHGTGYWRVDTMYDNQLGIGIQGDLPNDFKFQFVGAVYRDLLSGLNEYVGQASSWVHLPPDDTTGSRVMPPFSGTGNGGWPTTGGPLLTLKGEDIDMFILPLGVRAGTILQLGDRFDFAGQLMPALNSRVHVEVVAPGGQTHVVDGRANPVGYFYDPGDSFVVDQPGRWTATVRVWHDGKIGSGEQVDCDPNDPFDPGRPCPSGDVLGSADGAFSFYVVPPASPRLALTAPMPGRLTFEQGVTPIEIRGPIPAAISGATVDYTISMPGFILAQGQAQIANGEFSLIFDPQTLHADFPNLDLVGRYGWGEPGLSDTFSFGLLLSGQQDGAAVYRATTLTIQGDQVYVENADDVIIVPDLYLPFVTKGN